MNRNKIKPFVEFESMDENVLGFKDNLCFTSIFMKFGKKSSEGKKKNGTVKGRRKIKKREIWGKKKGNAGGRQGSGRTHHPNQSCM